MEEEAIRLILEKQRDYFATGITLNPAFRKEILKKLKSLILKHEKDLTDALWTDFHKPEFESVATETRFVVKELNYAIRNLKRWVKPAHVYTPIVHFISNSYIIPQPYGQVLILSPWNFPFQLSFMPIVGAIAAGNVVILKSSSRVPSVNSVMERILNEIPHELIAFVKGDHDVNNFLLDQKFDYIFFTGSPAMGKQVMRKAAENLTPVSLELGGKNPCVVAADAKLDYAARRIVWGKMINCGQTCVSPDYLLIDRRIKEKFLEFIRQEITSFYGDDPLASNDFARVISSANAERLKILMSDGEIFTGGLTDIEKKYVSPTILKNIRPDDAIMQEEIFGPVLPVIDFDNFGEVFDIIKRNPKPLATYIFTRDKKLEKLFLNRTQSGNAAVNETVMQIASPYLPYGGVGTSGMGRYHGKKSFDTFSNNRSVLKKSNLIDIPLRYPPYSKIKTNIIRFLLR